MINYLYLIIDKSKIKNIYFTHNSDKKGWFFFLHIVIRSLAFWLLSIVLFFVVDYFYYQIEKIFMGFIICPAIYN